MNKTVYTIGRDESCDICLYDSQNTISRYHAVLKICGRGRYVIVDQSLNGTYINGVKIVPEKEVPVSRKDTVSFAKGVNLDWSLVPDRRKDKKRVALCLFSALLAVLVIVCLVLMLKNTGTSEADVVDSEYLFPEDSYPVKHGIDRENGVEPDFIRRLPEKEQAQENVADSLNNTVDNVRAAEDDTVNNIDAIY